MRRAVALGLLMAALVLSAGASLYYRSEYRTADRRASRLLTVVNGHCNEVHTVLATIREEQQRNDPRHAVPDLMNHIQSSLFDCATSREALEAAGQDTEKMLKAIPQRDLDDPTLADRADRITP